MVSLEAGFTPRIRASELWVLLRREVLDEVKLGGDLREVVHLADRGLRAEHQEVFLLEQIRGAKLGDVAAMIFFEAAAAADDACPSCSVTLRSV